MKIHIYIYIYIYVHMPQDDIRNDLGLYITKPMRLRKASLRPQSRLLGSMALDLSR